MHAMIPWWPRAARWIVPASLFLFSALAPRGVAEDFGVLLAATRMDQPEYHLRVAAEDLHSMQEAFTRGLGIREDRLVVVAGAALSRQNVERVFWDLRRRVRGPRGDRVFVYFTGHGTKTPRADHQSAARAFLLATARPPERGDAFHSLHVFTEDDLREWLAPLRDAGVRTVLLLDCGFDPAPGSKSAALSGVRVSRLPYEPTQVADMELAAAAPGRAAYVRHGGGGSLFTAHLAAALLDEEVSRLDASTLAARVQQGMRAERKEADLYFHPARPEFGAAAVLDRTVGVVFLPVVTFDGAPLAGVEVVEETPEGRQRSLGRTDAQGQLRLRGRVRVVKTLLRKPGFLDQPATFEISWGETRLEPVVLVPEFVWIDGKVESDVGAPLAGASVRLEGSSIDDFLPGFHMTEATTGPDGAFSIRVRPGRAYQLLARSGSAISPTVAVDGGKALEGSRYDGETLRERRYALAKPLILASEGAETPSRRAFEESIRRGREFFDGGHFASARAYFEFALERAPSSSPGEVDEWLRRCAIAEQAQEIRLQMDEAFEAERFDDVRRHWDALERLLEEEGQNLGSAVVAHLSEGVLGPDGMLHRVLDEDIPVATRRTFEAAKALDESGDLLAAVERYQQARDGANEFYRARIDEHLADLDARIEAAFQDALRKGRASLRGGDAATAKSWAAEALRLRPGRPLARALQEDAEREDVSPEIKKAVQEGERQLSLGEPENAVEAFQRALASPANRFYRQRAEDGLLRASKAASIRWQDAARDRTLQGDEAGAAQAWQRVLQYEPGFPPALAALDELGWKVEVRESLAFERARRWFSYDGDDREEIRQGIRELRGFLKEFPRARRAPQVERALRRLEQRPDETLPGQLLADEDLPGQGRDPASGLPLRVRLAADPTIVLCLIPSGEFVLGDECGEGDADESPARRLRFAEPFYLGLTEITWAQYLRYVEEAGMDPPDAPRWGVRDDDPAVNVSWTEARAFCLARGGRLPTEAEWEYAAKAAQARRYPWGDEIDPSRANFESSGLHQTTRVGRYPFGASRWGPLDMAGNVWEWCEDWYDARSYASMRDSDLAGRGPLTGSERVLRGGSWFDGSFSCRVTNRSWGDPEIRVDIAGFRIAADAGRGPSGWEPSVPLEARAGIGPGAGSEREAILAAPEAPAEEPAPPVEAATGAVVAGGPVAGAAAAGEGNAGVGDEGSSRTEVESLATETRTADLPSRSAALESPATPLEEKGGEAPPSPGPASEESPPPPTRVDSVTRQVTHTVQEGETLVSIARAFYGRPRYAASIARRNGIHSMDQVITGMDLVLPRIPGVTMNLEDAVTESKQEPAAVEPGKRRPLSPEATPSGVPLTAVPPTAVPPTAAPRTAALPTGEKKPAGAAAPGGQPPVPGGIEASGAPATVAAAPGELLEPGKAAPVTRKRPEIRTASGLKYVDDVLGTGAMALPGNTVVVHYEGTLEDGTRIDSTRERGQPLEFRLGARAVIQGLEEGVIGMRAGGKRLLEIPPKLAFGSEGIPGLVPADATVHFLVELVSVR